MITNSKDSTLVKQIQYDPATLDLTVTLHTGKQYTYPNTTPEEHNRFVSAPSHGQHFSNVIRKKEHRT
jgi:hypothetical protein